MYESKSVKSRIKKIWIHWICHCFSVFVFLFFPQGSRLPTLWWFQSFKELSPKGRQGAWLHANVRWTCTRAHDSGLQLPQEPAAQAQNVTRGSTHICTDANTKTDALTCLLAYLSSILRPITETFVLLNMNSRVRLLFWVLIIHTDCKHCLSWGWGCFGCSSIYKLYICTSFL